MRINEETTMKIRSVRFCNDVTLPGGNVSRVAQIPGAPGEVGPSSRFALEWDTDMRLLCVTSHSGEQVFVPVQNVASFVRITESTEAPRPKETSGRAVRADTGSRS